MKVKCIHNTGKALIDYKFKPLGTTNATTYGQLIIGSEYYVMGIIFSNGYLKYLIDDGENTYFCLSQLFIVIENDLNKNFYFKNYTKDYYDFVNRQAVLGYEELVFNDNHFLDLLELKEEALNLFFRKKREVYPNSF